MLDKYNQNCINVASLSHSVLLVETKIKWTLLTIFGLLWKIKLLKSSSL